MRHLFIINPVSGGRNRTREISEQVVNLFRGSRDNYEVYVTKSAGDATEKVRFESAIDAGDVRIYACGGDGTLNECVNGAVGQPHVSVAHYPLGTGNDFIKTFDHPEKFKDLRNLAAGTPAPMDVIKCNDRYCLNICSVGVDARIGTEVHKYSGIPLVGEGAGKYIISLAANFIKGVNKPMHIKCAGRVFDCEIALACACNGRFYGGSFNPVPGAMPDDGYLDFLIVRQMSRLNFIRIVGKYAKGMYRRYPEYITYLKDRHMDIQADETFVVNLDGEAIYTKHAEISIIDKGINFIIPEGVKIISHSHANSKENESKWEVNIV